MESPFSKHHQSTVVLYVEPYLNNYYKQYQQIITLSGMPTGPLAEMVSLIPMTKLSQFQSSSVFSNGQNCTYVLLRYQKHQCGNGSFKNMDCFMTVDDIPSVFSYLQENGYIIDTSMTKMLQNSKVDIGGISEKRLSGNQKMVCLISRRTHGSPMTLPLTLYTLEDL